MIETLQGQAANKAQSGTATEGGGKPKFRTRGLNFRTRGAAPASPPAEIKTKAKKVYTTRGLAPKHRGPAKPLASTDSEEATVTVKATEAPEYNPNVGSKGDLAVKPGDDDVVVISYSVDPESKLKGQIQFAKGSTEIIGADSYKFIEELIGALNSDVLKNEKFVVEGHASADGNALSNQTLSQNRANAITRMLAARGVSEDRILPVGVGEAEARFPASSPEKVLTEDRRVLIYRLE